MKTKEFIQRTLIEDIGSIAHTHAYLSFILICIGIEFLGKCLDLDVDWHHYYEKDPRKQFRLGIALFPEHYKKIQEALYSDLRNGMAHGFNPRSFKLGELKFDNISYKDHLIKISDVIIIDHFYSDFAIACHKVLAMKFDKDNKVNKDYLKTDIKI